MLMYVSFYIQILMVVKAEKCLLFLVNLVVSQMSVTFVLFTSDFTQRWRSLSELPPHCNYKIKAAQDPGVIFYSPLPACQSETKVRPYYPSTGNGCKRLLAVLRTSKAVCLKC